MAAMARANRSLERGLAILGCFRPGTGLLSHREVTERTGLPKPTVTRLLATLRGTGYLSYDPVAKGYRLGVPVLSLAYAYELESEFQRTISPLITAMAAELKAIIGIGTAHGSDIVYVAASNGDPDRAERSVGPGMRTFIGTSAVGRAYLAGLPAAEREATLAELKRSPQWRLGLHKAITQSLRDVARDGHCLVAYSDGRTTALGTAFPVRGAALVAASVSFATGARFGEVPAPVLEGMQRLRAAVAADELEHQHACRPIRP